MNEGSDSEQIFDWQKELMANFFWPDTRETSKAIPSLSPEGPRAVSHGGVARGLGGAGVMAVPDGVGAAAAGRHAEAVENGGKL